MVAGHGLVVGSAHDDAHLVGSLRVLWVVGIEGPAPHGRPEHVALQAQNELEHFLIEAMVAIVSAVGVLHPRRQTGGLIVEEQAAPAHCRLTVGVGAVLHVDRSMTLDGGIGPPVPRRNAQLAAQLVDAVDGTATVAAHDGEAMILRVEQVHLDLALQLLLTALQAAGRAHHYGGVLSLVGKAHRGAAHALQVGLQVAGRPHHAALLLAAHVDRHTSALVQLPVATLKVNKLVGGLCPWGGCQHYNT